MFDRLADFFNTVEQIGVWPKAFMTGLISLISKGEGSAPLKLRPLTVMSSVYRLWASARVNDLMQWQDGWISDALRGFRRKCGAEDIWWELAAQIELSLMKGEQLFGFHFDYAKCFDRVLVHIVFEIAAPGSITIKSSERCRCDASSSTVLS